jgi:hypothetical protein
MIDEVQQEWYSVRCFFRFDRDTDSTKRNTYEERITIWRAASFAEAIELAEREADEYARFHKGEYTGLAQAYELPEVHLTSGAEVFSLLRESDLSPRKYLDRFFDTGDERQGEMQSRN